MNLTYKDLIGQRFGRLMVVEHVGTRSKSALWKCKCDCGNTTEVISGNLVRGGTQSCGCLVSQLAKERMTTHGKHGTRLYKIWQGMNQRCNNSNYTDYDNYGGRGITVCDEWSEFMPFYRWAMNNGYKNNLSIDRINNDGNYETGNCKWSTMKEQANNKRTNVCYEYQNQKKNLTQWSEQSGISRYHLYQRIRRDGWTIEKALNTPIGTYKYGKGGKTI